ncbi:MAG: hypothetical protein H0T76_16265 [Nannocystis sp.]|nr:hypothetical protein [Nannocystis sp.]MBA3548036.1 hypothetical protein [Nannocystis sp.]
MILKIAGLVVLVLALVLTGLWFMYVQAPPPELVCEHKMAITLAEAGEQRGPAVENLLDQLKLKCVKDKRTLLQLRGKIAYARQARCILAATTLSESERCG